MASRSRSLHSLLPTIHPFFAAQPHMRDVFIEGHAGVEYRWQRSKTYTILERWYCVDERLYVFSVNWLSAKPFPARATMILDSFRPLPKEQPSR